MRDFRSDLVWLRLHGAKRIFPQSAKTGKRRRWPRAKDAKNAKVDQTPILSSSWRAWSPLREPFGCGFAAAPRNRSCLGNLAREMLIGVASRKPRRKTNHANSSHHRIGISFGIDSVDCRRIQNAPQAASPSNGTRLPRPLDQPGEPGYRQPRACRPSYDHHFTARRERLHRHPTLAGRAIPEKPADPPRKAASSRQRIRRLDVIRSRATCRGSEKGIGRNRPR